MTGREEDEAMVATCDCQRGERLCPEAVRLYKAFSEAWDAGHRVVQPPRPAIDRWVRAADAFETHLQEAEGLTPLT